MQAVLLGEGVEFVDADDVNVLIEFEWSKRRNRQFPTLPANEGPST